MPAETEPAGTFVPEDEPENPLMPIAPAALEVMERAQIDSMMALAARRPRPQIGKIRQAMLDLATLDEETAESCIYTLKRWDAESKSHKLIQGPSIRLAEILTVCWRNLRAGARTIDNDGRKVTAQGVCFDVENNVMMFAEVSRRITHKEGRPYSEDMQLVTAAACCSIAKRNAVFQVVPFALIKPVYNKVLEVATGAASTIETKREKIFKRLYSMGVTKERILAVLGKESLESVNLEDLGLLIGLGTAIKDREMTVEEAFAPAAEGEESGPAKGRLRELRDERRAQKAAQAEKVKEDNS